MQVVTGIQESAIVWIHYFGTFDETATFENILLACSVIDSFHLHIKFQRVWDRMYHIVLFSMLCRASYIGQTVSHWHTRVSKHLGSSTLPANKSSNPTFTSVLLHLNSTPRAASVHDFKMLSSHVNSDERLTRESLLILKLKTSCPTFLL
jgi:hypothetical protein